MRIKNLVKLLMALSFLLFAQVLLGKAQSLTNSDRLIPFSKCRTWLNQICPPLKGRVAAVRCAWLEAPSSSNICNELVDELVSLELLQIEANAICNMRWRCKNPLFREKNPTCGTPAVEEPCNLKQSHHEEELKVFDLKYQSIYRNFNYTGITKWLTEK